MKNIFILLNFFFLLLGCESENNPKDISNPVNVSKIDTISYELKSISKELGDCDDTPEQCTTAKVQYVALNDPNHHSINTILTNGLKGEATSIEASLGDFIKEAKSFYQEFPEAAAGYAMEVEQTVLFNSSEIFTIEEFTYAFTGGAHGNYGTSYYNFDIAKGQKIELTDILKANYEPALKMIAEPIFKAAYLSEGMTKYSEAGFYFENDEFILTDNYAITKQGLKFVYNPYEVAPYALGQQEIVIPYTLLQELIKKEGLISGF